MTYFAAQEYYFSKYACVHSKASQPANGLYSPAMGLLKLITSILNWLHSLL